MTDARTVETNQIGSGIALIFGGVASIVLVAVQAPAYAAGRGGRRPCPQRSVW